MYTENSNRMRLFFMGSAYCLATFNDNFFKQAALLLAIGAGLTSIQGLATSLYALPFVICAAWCGWLADRLPKNRIIIGAKVLELAAALCGAIGIITLHWAAIVAMVTIMGLQAVVFGPALNGSIPELFPINRVAGVNAILKLTTTVSILIGIGLAGIVLDQTWGQAWLPPAYNFGQVLTGCVVVLASFLGLVSAFFIGGRVSPKSQTPFPWAGPMYSMRDCWLVRKDPLLCLALAGEAYFYFMSALAILVINNLGLTQLGLSKTLTSLLSAALMTGLCAGAGLAGRGTPLIWRKWMAPACLAIGLCMCASGFSVYLPFAWRLPFTMALYLIAGVASGLYLIPLSSFIQVRPAPYEKGRVQGISYFACFSGILIAGELFILLGGLPASTGIITVGLLSIAVSLAWFLIKRRLFARAGSIGQDNITLSNSVFL